MGKWVLYANHYELEILRLLFLFAPENEKVRNGQTAMQNGVPLLYLLLAFTEINNEKTRDLIRQKKEYFLCNL